jgi:hypothetical protein
MLTPVAGWTQAPVPTPESVLGFAPGADFELADYDDAIEYFRRLDDASDKLQLIEVGRTSRGRPWYLALISSPENLARIERYREIAQRLAHPEGLTDAEARSLAGEGRAFVDISGGLHASEVAGAQHTIKLAHDLVSTEGDPRTDAILEEVVLMLWPSLNPDGQEIVVDWYRENVGTPYEAAPLHELYQEYIGHDNNRDGYMLNVPESRVVTRTWREWEPQIIYVHHQSSPFPTRIWLPPFAEPIASRSPALIVREINAIGMLIAQELEARGQEGATHAGTGFDAWYPGYIDYTPVLQNIAAYWTETALYRYATPHFYQLGDFPANARDFRPGALYVSPWEGGWWRLRDAVEYMVTASFATLDYAAKYREQLLYNRYQAGRDAIRRYEAEPPFAYLVSQDQLDPMAAVELLRRLAFNGVRVHQLEREAAVDGLTHPAGTWVIPMDQEFAELVRQVLEVQQYPDLREYPEGPPEQPYDAAGWTLPYAMDVRVVAAQSPLSPEFREAMRPVTGEPIPWESSPTADLSTNAMAAGIVPPPGRITGSGAALAVDPAENAAFTLINRAFTSGGRVRFAAGAPVLADGETSVENGPATPAAADPRGARYLVSGIDGGTLEEWVDELALRAGRTRDDGPAVRSRIAIYEPWTASMDAGWTRWLFDRYGFEYSTIRNADLQAANLRERYDVIVLASDPARTLLDGYAEGTVPPRYAGGIGAAGARALDAFVRAGGTLVCLNRSTTFAIEQLHLPVRDVLADLERDEFFASGSILEVITDPAHPIMAGMPQRAKVFVDDSPAFTTLDGFSGQALAKYAPAGSPLLSGYLLGEEHLNGLAAALDVRHGAGHVILIGFRPQWRGQPHGTFRVLFNAVLFANDHAAGASGTPGFWEASEVQVDTTEIPTIRSTPAIESRPPT